MTEVYKAINKVRAVMAAWGIYRLDAELGNFNDEFLK